MELNSNVLRRAAILSGFFIFRNLSVSWGKASAKILPYGAIIPDIVKVRYFTATYNLPADFLL